MTKLFFVLLGLVAIQAHAADGVINGGGGKGVLCVQPDGSRSLESLDRYEARLVWKYSLPTSRDFDSEFLRVMSRLDAIWAGDVQTEPPLYSPQNHDNYLFAHRKFEASLNFLPAGARLRYTPDAGEAVVPPPNCSLVQVITYMDEGAETGSILVDQEYWNMITPQDRVAFFLHEFIYKSLRVFGEKNSARVRKMTGRLISTEIYTGILEPVRRAKKALECFNNAPKERDADYPLHFYLVPGKNERGEDGTTLVFDTIGRRGMLATTTAFSSLTFDVWEKKTWLSGSDQIDISSFLGYEYAKLVFENGSEERWFIHLKDEEDRMREIGFHCSPLERR